VIFMGNMKSTLCGIAGAGLITAGAAVTGATHKANEINSSVNSKGGIARCIANHTANSRIREKYGDGGLKAYKDLARNPAKNYAIGLGLIGAGMSTALEGVAGKRKRGGAMSGTIQLDDYSLDGLSEVCYPLRLAA
jgi:hypothetical protein